VESSLVKERAFVDTSVLTDALLKPGEPRKRANAALARFTATLLPVYAIKEFQAGPFASYCWMHNVLVNEQSLSRAMQRVQAVSRTPQRYLTSTAMEAMAIATSTALGAMDAVTAQAKYGPQTTFDVVGAAEVRLNLRSLILRAWRKRRRVTTAVVNPLSCYNEADPIQERGLIVVRRWPCTLEPSVLLQNNLVPYELTRDNTCEESCGRGGGGVEPWAC
jgi:predicted nucleic acid-binding protein